MNIYIAPDVIFTSGFRLGTDLCYSGKYLGETLEKKGNQDKGSCLVDFITKGMGLAGGHNRRQKES